MNKRITYLLATLLIAEAAIPVSAQAFTNPSSSYSAHNTTYLSTLAADSNLTARTSGPSITVSVNRIYATEVADARAELSFKLHNVTLKDDYTNQAASLHIALDENIRLTSITSSGEESNISIKTPGVVTIYNNREFTFKFTATNISPESILRYDHFKFKIPGHLLTSGEDLLVEVPIEKDQVEMPTVPPATTSAGIKLVSLNHNSEYSNIRYTLDGSDVTLESTPYTKGTSIRVEPSVTLKAVAFIGTMPSDQMVIEYDDIPVASDSSDESTSEDNSSNNGGATSEDNSSNNSGSTPEDNSSNNGGSTSEDNSSNNGGSTSEDNSSNNGGSNSENDDSNLDHDTSVEQDKEDLIGTDSSQSIADYVSDAVTNLIEQKERNLTLKATPVSYGLSINNQKVELENKLLLHNGRTLAPLRTIVEALNIPIHYHALSKTAIIKTSNRVIEFPLGYNVAIVDGKVVQIDAQDETILSTIHNGRTYLPLRFIAEQLNLDIHFNGEQINLSL